MIWVIVVTLIGYASGDVITRQLDRSYISLTECVAAKEFIYDALKPYWPNPASHVKSIDVECITERPYGD